MMKKTQYQYDAKLERIVDGDTIIVNIDLGFGVTWKTSIRMYGFDTPERGEEGHDESIQTLTELLPQEFIVTTVKDNDKYGRYLADIADIAGSMITRGQAVSYFGGKKMPAAESLKIRTEAKTAWKNQEVK